MILTIPTATDIGGTVVANLPVAELYEHAIRAAEGTIAAEGPLVVRTGLHTGRSPRDKFVVREPWSQDKVWWGEVNHEISEEHYDRLRARLVDYVADRQLYAQDMYIGAHPQHRRSLRVYTETAWASIFARNLFRRPPREDLAGLCPQLHDHQRAQLPGGSRHRRDPERHGDPAPPAADGGHHRRHDVRGRDQEVRVHRHELPDARRGRAPDALLDQRGRRW